MNVPAGQRFTPAGRSAPPWGGTPERAERETAGLAPEPQTRIV
jgi:hypothetical protein